MIFVFHWDFLWPMDHIENVFSLVFWRHLTRIYILLLSNVVFCKCQIFWVDRGFSFPHFAVLLIGAYACLCMHSQSCLTFWDPMDCSQPGPSVHGNFEARILEWFGISSSRRSSQLKDQTCVSCISGIGRQILYHCATWEFLHLGLLCLLGQLPFLLFFFYYYMSLSLVIFFALRSTLSDINGAIPAFF